MNIDELMIQYRQLNNQVAENKQLNEKIFQELMFQKSRSILKNISLYDYFGVGIFIIFIVSSVFYTLKYRDNEPLFIVSLIGIIFWIGGLIAVLYPIFIWQKLKIGEEEIKKSMEKIHRLHKAYNWQKKGTMIFFPVCMLLVPVFWMEFFNFYFLDLFLYNCNWWRIAVIIVILGLAIVFTPFLYKITHFKWLDEIKNSLQQLED